MTAPADLEKYLSQRYGATGIIVRGQAQGAGWREDLTRYGIIDPTIRALGWDTADPKECHPEYPRSENGDRVDYAFFTRLDLAKLEEEDMPAPDIIVEAKALVLSQLSFGNCLRKPPKLLPFVRVLMQEGGNDGTGTVCGPVKMGRTRRVGTTNSRGKQPSAKGCPGPYSAKGRFERLGERLPGPVF